MSRRRKITWWVLTVLLILAAVWFYWFYFMSTNAAIRHAEAFLFRRMTVAQLDEGSYRHFYVTNRVEEEGDAPIEDRFTRERTDSLTFGNYDTSIRPTLGLGMIINPTEWFQNEEISLDEVRKLEREQFVSSLRDVVDASPGRSLLIVIHGFRERFPSALRKTAFVASVLDLNTPILLFDWPGNQGSSLRGYRRAREVAGASGADLAKTLEIIIRDVQPDRLALIANSMGGEVVVDAFSILYEQEEFADVETEILDVILTAPDVDHAEFNERFKHEIQALAKSLTVYVSSNDRALLMSRLVNRSKRAGEASFSPDQLDEAISISALTDADDDLVTLVDVTPVNRTRNFHNFSLETPEFFDDLYLRLVTDEQPRNRLVYRVEFENDSVYWVLTRGR